MNKKMMIAAGTLAAALGVGTGVATLAQADSQTPTPPASSSAGPTLTPTSPAPGDSTQAGPTHDGTEPGHGRGDRAGMGHPGGIRGADISTLAGKLGVSEATLRTALDNVRSAMRGTAPTTRPQDQTQAEREAARTARQTEFASALAKELGIDQAKVTAALDEIEATEQAARKTDFDSRIDAAVKAGTLTQAEGDAVKKAAEKGVIGMGGPGRGR